MDVKDIEGIIGKLKDIPYQHNGRSMRGVDCWGLIYLFFKELGIRLPISDGSFAPDDWYKKQPERYGNALKTLGEEVGHYRNLKPLDIPYFRLYRDVITHSGVMLDRQFFLHVLIDKKVRVDSFNRLFWRAKYAGAIRVDLNKYRRKL